MKLNELDVLKSNSFIKSLQLICDILILSFPGHRFLIEKNPLESVMTLIFLPNSCITAASNGVFSFISITFPSRLLLQSWEKQKVVANNKILTTPINLNILFVNLIFEKKLIQRALQSQFQHQQSHQSHHVWFLFLKLVHEVKTLQHLQQ